MVNKDDLIAYLLHTMPEDARGELGEQWMSDPELHEQLRMAEAELLDGYVRCELDSDRRSRVETYLLSSESQRRKLIFARALQTAVSPYPRRGVAWRPLAFGSAAAALVLAGVAIWFAGQNRNLQRELIQARNVPRPASAGVYAAALAPDVSRGTSSESAIPVPADAQLMRFDLELGPGDETPSYSVTLLSSGRTLWREEPIRGERRGLAFVAPVWIPSVLLKPGIYELKLDAAGTTVNYYRFRTLR